MTDGGQDFARLAGRGLLLQLFLLASGPAVARLLGPEGRGELALAMAIALLFSQALLGGIGVAIARTVAAADSPARSVVRPHLARWHAYGLAAGLLAASAVHLMFSVSDSDHRSALVLGAFGIAVLAAWNQVAGAMLRGQGDVTGVTVIPIATVLAYVAGVVACLFLAPGANAEAVAGIYIASQILGLLLSWRRLPSGAETSAGAWPLGSLARRSWATAVNTLGLGFDQLVVFLLLGSHVLGLYVVAVSITNVPAMALRLVASMLMPRLVAASPDRRAGMTKRWLAAAAGLAVVLAVGLQVIIAPVIRILFGEEFTAAIPTARIMIVAWGFLAFRLMLVAVLQARGQAGRASVVEVLCTAVLIPATALGAFVAGIEGVAVAMAVTAALACILGAHQLRSAPATVD
jgi:O-antigen/teichoic acid export membrane protein